MSQTRHATYSNSKPQRSSALPGLILGALLLVFLAAFGYASYLFFQTARTIIVSAPQLQERDIPVTADSNTVQEGQLIGEAVVADPAVAEQDIADDSMFTSVWSERERINVLLLGVDARPGQKGNLRTDTIMVATIDPNSGDVGLVSLPRDLYVDVPGYGNKKINTAHVIGGPDLAIDTVSQFLGIPIQSYVRINFDGFRRVLDEIGCIDIDVPKTIDDPLFPDDNYGYDPFYIEAGHYCMDATTALKYARTRHADSDFERMARQQQVLAAIKNKVLDTGQLPRLIGSLPALLSALTDSLQTDIPTGQQIALARLARNLNTDHIRGLVIDRSMTTSTNNEAGYVLIPQMDVVHPAVAAFFNPDVESLPTPAPRNVVSEQIMAENVRVVILNGTTQPELGQRVAEALAAQGYNIVGIGDADRSDYGQTQLIAYNSPTFTQSQLVEMFAIGDENIRPGASANGQADLQIIIGSDVHIDPQ
ncbi:MAG: LCP family protein [Caldilineales bacterium]|nr:LCP family protein [Caldilineales bacterium]